MHIGGRCPEKLGASALVGTKRRGSSSLDVGIFKPWLPGPRGNIPAVRLSGGLLGHEKDLHTFERDKEIWKDMRGVGETSLPWFSTENEASHSESVPALTPPTVPHMHLLGAHISV